MPILQFRRGCRARTARGVSKIGPAIVGGADGEAIFRLQRYEDGLGLGLKEHLAPTRANALNLMATQMKQRALEFSAE